MMQRNCPNCGAPYDVELNKCPYCGTSYFDMSAIDMEMHEPFFLKIRTQVGGAPACITAKVVPSLVTIEANSDEEVSYGYGGAKMWSFIKDRNIDFGLKLRAVEDKGTLCVVETIET